MANKLSLGVIDPETTSGSDLAAMLSLWASNVESGYFGSIPPDDVQRGQTFVQAINPTLWQLKLCLAPGYHLLLMSLNPQTGDLVFEGGIKQSPGTPVPSARQVLTAGSLDGGGYLNADLTLRLKNDVPLNTNIPNTVYSRDANNVVGWHTLPAAAPTGPAAASTPGTRKLYVLVGQGSGSADTFNVPAKVSGIWLNLYGPGGSTNGGLLNATPGGSVSGWVPVTPGQGLAVQAGTAGGFSMVTCTAGQIICASGGPQAASATTIPPGLAMMATAPVLMAPNCYGMPDSPGAVWIEWIE